MKFQSYFFMYVFQLFQKAKKQPVPKIIKWFVLLFLIVVAFCLAADRFKTIKMVLLLMALLISGYIVFYLATNHKRFHFLKGIFTGTIAFANEGIYLNSDLISYDDINEITFTNHDFIGKFNKHSFLNPSVSIGVMNGIRITLKSGEIIERYFQMKHDHELFNAFKFLNQNKIPYLWNEKFFRTI